jgi:hypothetical protein
MPPDIARAPFALTLRTSDVCAPFPQPSSRAERPERTNDKTRPGKATIFLKRLHTGVLRLGRADALVRPSLARTVPRSPSASLFL